MASEHSSKLITFVRHLPKAQRTLLSVSTLLVACSLTLFAFAIPPVLDGRAGDILQGGLIGAANGETPDVNADASDDEVAGSSSFSGGDIAPVGAKSLGSVIASSITSSAGDGHLAPQETQGQQTPQNPQGSQNAQDSSSSATQTPSSPSSQTEYSGLADDFHNAGNHYGYLSNYVAGSPMFEHRGPGSDPNNWVDLQAAYSMSRECISEASAFEKKYAQLVEQYPASKRELSAIRDAWSSISSAASLFIRFLDAARACPDPATHSACFMGIVEGHIVSVSSGSQTYYTLRELEAARQTLTTL